jgi:hypothetical protein
MNTKNTLNGLPGFLTTSRIFWRFYVGGHSPCGALTHPRILTVNPPENMIQNPIYFAGEC